MAVNIDHAALQAMFSDPAGPVGKIIEQKCIAVETLAKILVATPGSGREYPEGSYFLNRDGKLYAWKRSTSHRASAPGEPPSSDTGNLLSNIGHSITVEDTVVGHVRASTRYAMWLETGTRFMAPRPFLRPALAAAS